MTTTSMVHLRTAEKTRGITSMELVVSLLLLCLLTANVRADEARQRILFDAGWQFVVAPERAGTPPADLNLSSSNIDESKWRTVHLPHDYVIESPINNERDSSHGGYTLTPAWYRKSFTLPVEDKGRSIWIDFDGVYRDAVVYLNGKQLGENKSGYVGFRYDISPLVKFGEQNLIQVHVDPRTHEGWWYEGGGIYRHVWLNIANPIHLASWGTFVSSQLPEPGLNGAEKASVAISTQLVSSDPLKDYKLESSVIDSTGKVVESTNTMLTSELGSNPLLSQSIDLKNPHLWTLEDPYLYRLRSTIKNGNEIIDETETPFGVRTIRFDADKGFFLNGKHVKLQGFCNHQDFAAVGVAVPDTLEEWRVAKLKSMGCNAWRMSHNPPNPELLDACDRLGMLVIDENRHFGDTDAQKANKTTPFANLSELRAMIQRDRNHPSIITWSMSNEEPESGTAHGTEIFKAMMVEVRKWDTTRPISCAMNSGWFAPEGVTGVEDTIGVNYYFDTFDKFHALHPKLPMYSSESASTRTTRGQFYPKLADGSEPPSTPARRGNWFAPGFMNSYNMTDDSWKPIISRDFVAGSFDWTGFDYKGEPSPTPWPAINSHFGLFDMCGFPKDNVYYLKSWWMSDPLVHLLPHWNWPDKVGNKIDVIAFSNCDSVELFLNGNSLGSQVMPRYGHLNWDVTYAPGTLTAKGTTAGKVVAEDSVETAGVPASLRLKADRVILKADGEDVLPVEVDVLDAQGRIVPTANNHVTFSIGGAAVITGVGNGNPIDHDPDTASFRNAFNGKCLVVVKAGETPGAIQLAATSDGLASASISLSSIK